MNSSSIALGLHRFGRTTGRKASDKRAKLQEEGRTTSPTTRKDHYDASVRALFVADDAANDTVIGVIAPHTPTSTFEITVGDDELFAVSSAGVVTVLDNSTLEVGVEDLTIVETADTGRHSTSLNVLDVITPTPVVTQYTTLVSINVTVA